MVPVPIAGDLLSIVLGSRKHPLLRPFPVGVRVFPFLQCVEDGPLFQVCQAQKLRFFFGKET